MIDTRYKKLKGMHAGHAYKVVEPYSEIDAPLKWLLQCETIEDEKMIVSEDDLADRDAWEPLD